MADEAQGTGTQAAPAAAPQAQAAQALGSSMMMDEVSPFPEDKSVPDQSEDIASIFGLGEEAGAVSGQPSNSPDGATGGGASPPAGASAAEGGQGQTQPATPATSSQPGQQGTTQAPAQQQLQAPAPAAPPAAPATGTAPAPSQDPTVQALTAQVQALTAHIAQLQGQQGQQGVGQQTPQQGQVDPLQQVVQHPLTNYQLAMPDDVAAAVFNEDPGVARQGLTHVINAVAREVHLRTMRHVDELVGQRLQSYGQQTTEAQHQEQMRQQYFAAYPQHNDPATRLIVAQEAQVMWGANPTQGWDQNAINALGQRVNARLGVVSQQQQQQSGQVVPFTAPQQGQPVPTPAAQLGASPRPAANPADNNGDFITDVLTA